MVEVVARALDVLDVFHDSEELGLNDVCERVGINKTRAFRLLCTLAERGYVEKTGDGNHYRLGVKLFERAANVRRDLKQIAQPFMRTLQERFNETVNLGILHEGEVLYIDIVESSRAFRMAAGVGSRMPVASTSMGRAMLAYMPDLPVSVSVSDGELDDVRQRGYARDNEDNEPGVACVGAPIFEASGRPIAAISVSGPVGRILDREAEIAALLLSTCAEISRHFGFVHAPSKLRRPAKKAAGAAR